MANWIEMVALDLNNKRCHVFVAWIRLIQNECEPYIYIKFFVDTLVLIWVSLQAANCA